MTDGFIPSEAASLAVSVNVIIFSVRDSDLKVLLLRRSAAPQRGRWMLPGEFVRLNEGLEEAARRELRDHTGHGDVYMEQLYTFGAPRRDPRGRVVAVTYLALVGAEAPPDTRAAGNASPRAEGRPAHGEAGGPEAAWHSVYALPEMGFDHADIIAYALRRARYKLEYTSVGFELLPNEFTLSELQAAYEVILGERLDKRNFRRRILEAEVLAETSRHRGGEGQGRPARLYRYKKNAVTEVKARRLFP